MRFVNNNYNDIDTKRFQKSKSKLRAKTKCQ